MSDPTCPAGMVLIKANQRPPHYDEPAFCIDATEVTQAADAAFWAARQQSGYELVVTKKDGTIQTERNGSEVKMRATAATQVQRGDVQSVMVRPVASNENRS